MGDKKGVPLVSNMFSLDQYYAAADTVPSPWLVVDGGEMVEHGRKNLLGEDAVQDHLLKQLADLAADGWQSCFIGQDCYLRPPLAVHGLAESEPVWDVHSMPR
ncbi:hypothetical protein MHU86_1462 [Fragilaria crotonensis]|nr:hypothetical protein MHU86_1462 [Fragilaria crotonensis]